MTRIWNSACGSIRLRVSGQLLLGCVLVGLWGTTGGAQGFGPDPFQPYNSDYSQYVWPIAPTNDYGYNSQALRGLRGANQFQSYMNSIQGQGTARSGRGGAGTPYYRANREYDRDFGRVYQPNEKADKRFDEYREKSTDLYFKYLRQTDPRKRAQLLREYNRARSESDRALSSSRANAGSGGRYTGSEARTSDAEEKGSSRERDPFGAPPPLSSARTRARGSESNRDTTGALGPAPAPLRNHTSAGDLGRAPSPTDVLDRALRSERDRPRVSPRRRSLGPVPPGPAPSP
jgi:hypothetical protein